MGASYAKWINEYVHVVHQYAQNELRACKEYQRNKKNFKNRASPWGRLAKLQSRVAYAEKIIKGDWNLLSLTSEYEVNEHLQALEQLKKKQSIVAELYRELPDLKFAFSKARPPSSRPNWEEERQRLRVLAEEKGADQETIEKGLSFLDNYDPKEEYKIIKNIVIKMYERLHQDWTRREAALMGSRFATLIASINTTTDLSNNEIDSLPLQVANFLEKLNQLESEIWLALKNNEDKKNIQEKALLLMNQATSDLNSFTLPKLSLISSLGRKSPLDPFIGGLSISLADLARRQLRAQAISDALHWAINFEGKVLSEWIKAAQSTTQYETIYKIPKAVNIDDLSSSPEQYDGQKITIEGLVKEVKIRHKGRERKVISTGIVAGENSHINVSLPFIKLDSGGFVPGAWCRIAGVWKSTSKDTFGMPSLEIARISYSKLGKESFSDWLTNYIAPIFSPIPHEIAGSWSWETGSDGIANPLKYGVWCRHERGAKRGRL